MDNANVLDYKIEISRDDEGDYIATMPELGCIADGSTIEEAINELKQVAIDFIKLAKEDGKLIPKPKKHDEKIKYSGKLTLRMPKSLHKFVTMQAQKDGCSINQLIMMYVSMGLGNEFGKNQVSISLDASPDMFQKLISEQWENHIPQNISAINDSGVAFGLQNFHSNSSSN